MECKPAINDEHRSGQWITQSAIHRGNAPNLFGPVLHQPHHLVTRGNCGGQWQRQLQLPGAGFSIHSEKVLSRPGSVECTPVAGLTSSDSDWFWLSAQLSARS